MGNRTHAHTTHTAHATHVVASSWISQVLYRRTPDGVTYLALFLRHDPTHDPVALLYTQVPSWMPGLILAGKGGRSVGSAYNSLLKKEEVQWKYRIQYQRVEGREQVDKLKEMMQS